MHFLLLHNSKFLSVYFLEKGAKLSVLLERMAEEKKKKKKSRFTLIVVIEIGKVTYLPEKIFKKLPIKNFFAKTKNFTSLLAC